MACAELLVSKWGEEEGEEEGRLTGAGPHLAVGEGILFPLIPCEQKELTNLLRAHSLLGHLSIILAFCLIGRGPFQ